MDGVTKHMTHSSLYYIYGLKSAPILKFGASKYNKVLAKKHSNICSICAVISAVMYIILNVFKITIVY